MNEFKNIRVFYTKKRKLKYVSHLDMQRCFAKVLKRSGLPLWYTKGYNPHLYLTFALPLSLGFESEYECVDFRITKNIRIKKITKRINNEIPNDLKIIRINYPKYKSKDINAARYEINLESDNANELYQYFNDFLNKEEIYVNKKSKKGYKTIDIKPLIKNINIKQVNKGIKINIILPAGDTMLNPNVLIEAYKTQNKNTYTSTDIIKKELYVKDCRKFI